MLVSFISAIDGDIIAIRMFHSIEDQHRGLCDREQRNARKRLVFIIDRGRIRIVARIGCDRRDADHVISRGSRSKVDSLRGFKENVITGHLIPAGTGSEKFQRLVPEKLGEELPPELDILEDDDEYLDEDDEIQEEYIYDADEAGNDLEEDAVSDEETDEEE